MPTLAPGSLVLVTGGTGYIACWVIRALLDSPNGYRVRGTVRSSTKGDSLKRIFSNEVEEGRFETVVVADMAIEGAFDKAIHNVDGIAHTASPVHLKADDPKELIEPAVGGTLGVLQSALKHSPSTKRIVILASTANIFSQPPPGESIVLNEENWNEAAFKDVDENGRNATPMNKYAVSKMLAEKAAIKFREEHKSEIGWDIVRLHPPYVLGPVLHDVKTPSELNTSADMLYQVLCTPNAGGKTKEELSRGPMSRIDVRDLAEAHVRAFEREEAGGQRIIVSAANFTWQDCIDVATHPSPSIPSEDRVYMKHAIVYDNSNLAKILGMSRFRGLEETVRDALDEFRRRGW